jgi:hypothetical protein
MAYQDDLKQVMLSRGFSYQDIQTVLDLSSHAAHEAMATVIRVSETAPKHIRLHVTLLTLAQLEAHIAAAGELCDKQLNQMGA